ncbi:rluD [Symbiodinium sp. CCMP2592]|nr:rluD [Symbiodinium sp. CCMP2592]
MAGENPEADIFRYCFPSGAPPSSTPTTTTVSDTATPAPTRAQSRSKRQRPDHHQRPHPPRGHNFATYQPMYTSPQDQKMMAITKLLLQHEDRINCLSLDRGLVMFLKEDTHSVLPAMMRAAREWNARKDQGDDRLVSPLRTVLLANLIKELQQRLQHVVATQEGRDSLRKAKWLAENGDWHYMKWCRKTKTLIPNEDRTPLQHTEAVRVLSFLYENLKYDIIQNFKSTQRLQHLEDQNRTSATFLLDISLRGSLAQEVYEHFEKLINCSLTGLIGMSLKKESMVRKPVNAQTSDSQDAPPSTIRVHQIAMPSFRLHNPNNLCYLNAVIYSLWAAAVHTGNMSVLPQVLRGHADGIDFIHIRRHLGFQLLGWRRPEQQHDATELINHLHPKLAASVVKGVVELRYATDTGIGKTVDAPITHCVILVVPVYASSTGYDVEWMRLLESEMRKVSTDLLTLLRLYNTMEQRVRLLETIVGNIRCTVQSEQTQTLITSTTLIRCPLDGEPFPPREKKIVDPDGDEGEDVFQAVADQLQAQDEYDDEDAIEVYETYQDIRRKMQAKKMGRGYKQPPQSSSKWTLTGTVRGKIEQMKSRSRCHICNEYGHWKRECPKKKVGAATGARSSRASDAMVTDQGGDPGSYELGQELFLQEEDIDQLEIYLAEQDGRVDVVLADPSVQGDDVVTGDLEQRIFQFFKTEQDQSASSEAYMADLATHGVPDTACRRTLIGESVLSRMSEVLEKEGLRVRFVDECHEFKFENAGCGVKMKLRETERGHYAIPLVEGIGVVPKSGATENMEAKHCLETMSYLNNDVPMEMQQPFVRTPLIDSLLQEVQPQLEEGPNEMSAQTLDQMSDHDEDAPDGLVHGLSGRTIFNVGKYQKMAATSFESHPTTTRAQTRLRTLSRHR